MKYHEVIWNIMKYRSHCSKQRLTALNQSVNPINQSINWSADSQHSSTRSLIAPDNCCLNAPLLPLWDSTLLQRHSSQFYSNSSFPTLFSAGSCADAWPVWANNSGAALPPHCRSYHTAVLLSPLDLPTAIPAMDQLLQPECRRRGDNSSQAACDVRIRSKRHGRQCVFLGRACAWLVRFLVFLRALQPVIAAACYSAESWGLLRATQTEC